MSMFLCIHKLLVLHWS